MSDAGRCQGCDRALSDAYLCPSCTGKLRAALDALPELLAELVITTYRQDTIALTVGGSVSSEKPLPFKTVAARLLHRTRFNLWNFASPATALPFIVTDAALCAGLAAELDARASKDPDVGRMYAVVLDDVAAIYEAIDIPKSFRYLGRCDECGTEMYADRAADVWVCDCGKNYGVKARMAELIERSRDIVAPTSTIATALTSMEYPVTEELIRKWVQRGMLTPRSNAGRQRWYRLGDVLDLILRQREKRASAYGQ